MNEKDYLNEFIVLLSLLSPETKEMLRAYLKALHNEDQKEKPKAKEKNI